MKYLRLKKNKIHFNELMKSKYSKLHTFYGVVHVGAI